MKPLGLTLAAILSITANFHSGLEFLQNKKYDQAVKKFSAVLEAKPAIAGIHDYALYYRAEAWLGSKKKAEALKDLAVLVKTTADKSLRKKAITRYRESGGVLKDLRPKDSPKETLNKLLAAAGAGDDEKIGAYFTGPLNDMMAMMDKIFAEEPGMAFHRKMLKELGQEADDIMVVSESIDDINRTATLALSIDHTTLFLELLPKDGKWAFASVQGFEEEHRANRPVPQPGRRSSAQGNLQKLRQIHGAMEIYRMDHGKLELQDPGVLKPYLGNEDVFFWSDQAGGKRQRFFFYPGENPAGKQIMIVAAPKPVGGKREVLFSDGRVENITEERFLKQVTAQKWMIPGIVKKGDVPPKIAGEVKVLINKLGDNDHKVRASAKKRLMQIGAPAFPFLEEQINNSDPEIKETVKEIMGLKRIR